MPKVVKSITNFADNITVGEVVELSHEGEHARAQVQGQAIKDQHAKHGKSLPKGITHSEGVDHDCAEAAKQLGSDFWVVVSTTKVKKIFIAFARVVVVDSPFEVCERARAVIFSPGPAN